ncbi:MAG: HAMP domain-containing histidine kinase, partial [Chlorobiales bacterium]|nr:HAMP domain-containing histidine kinase [Chlorobiales bacterium]
FSSGKERTYDVNGIGMDGVVRWYTTRILPVKHDDEVIAVTLNARDSSQVKGAETELKNHYRMLDSVFRAIPGTLLVLNRKLNIITSNHNGFEGLNQGSTGRFLKCYELIWKRNESCEECLAKRVFRTGEPLLEKHYCQESHKTREIRMFPVMNEVAKVRYVVVHLQDLESGVKDEKQEQMIEMKAKAAMHLKTEFLSKINHELKTPMIGILGFSKLGQERYKKLGREKIKSYFKTIQESGERLQMRLNNLLDLSQLEPGSEAYNFQTETLSMVTTIVLNELFNQIEEKRIKIDFIKPDFPDLVQMDVDKIGKVIRNLISSAVKVSKPDRSIKIKISKKAEQCQFAISDSGKRLSKAELEELFKAPVDEISNQEGSSERGMGLAIAKKIIGDHDGRIWAESPRRGGLTFKFALPCSE